MSRRRRCCWGWTKTGRAAQALHQYRFGNEFLVIANNAYSDEGEEAVAKRRRRRVGGYSWRHDTAEKGEEEEDSWGNWNWNIDVGMINFIILTFDWWPASESILCSFGNRIAQSFCPGDRFITCSSLFCYHYYYYYFNQFMIARGYLIFASRAFAGKLLRMFEEGGRKYVKLIRNSFALVSVSKFI